MKTNKMIIALGIVLLMSSSMILRSAIDGELIKPIFVRGRLVQKPLVNSTEKEPSDEEILAGHQFSGPINEFTPKGLPKFKRQRESLAAIREYYKRWATVDRQGAASEFKPKKQV